MSTYTEAYIIRGVRLDVDFISNLFNENHDLQDFLQFPWCGKGAEGTYGLLMDGMDGDYAVAGYCLMAGNGDCDGHIYGVIDITELRSVPYHDEIIDWLEKNKLASNLEFEDIKTFYVGHVH